MEIMDVTEGRPCTPIEIVGMFEETIANMEEMMEDLQAKVDTIDEDFRQRMMVAYAKQVDAEEYLKQLLYGDQVKCGGCKV